MPPAPLPPDEPQRLAALRDLQILDTGPAEAFDALAKAASLVCGVPIALVSLVDESRQWFKANIGLEGVTETPRTHAFCAYAILGKDILEVPDVRCDPRFADNPLVLGDPQIRFYAGAPLAMENGMMAGTLCVIGREPHHLTPLQREILGYLARVVSLALQRWRARMVLAKTAENLRRSEAFLEHAGRIAGVGGWEIDLASGALTWTAETYRIHGVGMDEHFDLAGALEFFPPEARDRLMRAVHILREEGQEYDLELPFNRADGARRWVRALGTRAGPPEAPERLIGAFQDITERIASKEALREAKERMSLATDSAGIGIWDWDIARGTMLWNDWMYRIYGLDQGSGAVPFNIWEAHLHSADLAAAKQALRDALENIRPYDCEFRIVTAAGAIRHLHRTAKVTFDAKGRPIRVVGADMDVTAARQMSAKLAEQNELLRVTLRSIGDGVITTDAQGNVVWLNPVAERLTGWKTAEALGRGLIEVFPIFHQETREPAANPVEACLKQNKAVALAAHTVLVSRDGGEYGIEDSAAPICNDAGETLGAVLVFRDVTEQRHLSGEMSHQATHDALTGLLNRSEFEVRLRFVLHKAAADRSHHALLFIDLDQFKIVNDTCGHAAGDDLLVQVAKLLGEIVRASDTIARLGGDEFAIILDHCAVEKAEPLAQKICDRMEHFRFTHGSQRFTIGASIGLVPVDARWASTAAVMQAADSSCFAAKAAGRNRVHLWFDSDQAMRVRHSETQWASRISQALDDDDFVLFAQRIQNLDARERAAPEGVHAEVLLRLAGHNGTLSMPGAFLPAAERFHIASRIDRWVLSRAIWWMNQVPDIERIETLCVNLSGQSVGDAAFHRWAIAMLSEAGPRICRRLCLEITETSAVTNLADAAVFIEQIRGIGVRVALDDFGAGASSFGYLKTMPVDFLKIDGQFIKDLATDTLDEAAVRCFADVAAVVGMQTIAEFVDKEEVLAKLKTMGIDFAQGFLIHKPAPIDELLTAHRAFSETPA